MRRLRITGRFLYVAASCLVAVCLFPTSCEKGKKTSEAGARTYQRGGRYERIEGPESRESTEPSSTIAKMEGVVRPKALIKAMQQNEEHETRNEKRGT